MHQSRGESWRARRREREVSVQAQSVGLTTLGRMEWRPTRLRPIARAWKDSSLVVLLIPPALDIAFVDVARFGSTVGENGHSNLIA